MNRKIIIIFMLITILCTSCDLLNNEEYTFKISEEACKECFGENVSRVMVNDYNSEIYCTGNYNKITVSGRYPTDYYCKDRDFQCKDQTKFKSFDTRHNYNCENIREMIELNYFPPILQRWEAIGCISNETYFVESINTAECTECAEDLWKELYFEQCLGKV